MKTLARFIQTKREELGLTQTGLAIAANIPVETIEEVEDGKELFCLLQSDKRLQRF